MDKKIVIFTYEGQKMCFSHALLYVLDLNEKGKKASLVIEGASTKLVKELIEENNPLFEKVLEKDLIDSVCKACSNQMGVLEWIQENTDLKLDGTLSGHPPISPYIDENYDIIVM